MSARTPEESLAAAIEAAGGPASVGKALAISSQAVSQWRVAPPARVHRLVELAGGKVTAHELRPDIFGPPPTQPHEGRAAA